MAAGINPIYTATQNFGGIGNALINTANTAYDGTGTVVTVFTAGTNGSFVQRLKMKAAGSGNNIQTVLRIFINNGGATSSATNNILFAEYTLSATTGVANAATQEYEFPMNITLQAGYKITVTVGTTVSAGYFVSVVGGDY